MQTWCHSFSTAWAMSGMKYVSPAAILDISTAPCKPALHRNGCAAQLHLKGALQETAGRLALVLMQTPDECWMHPG